jgi:hypothetical protein
MQRAKHEKYAAAQMRGYSRDSIMRARPCAGGTRQRNARTPYGKEERSKEEDTEESEAQSQEEII